MAKENNHPEIVEIIKDFVEEHGLKQFILIGTYGAIKNIEIDEEEE